MIESNVSKLQDENWVKTLFFTPTKHTSDGREFYPLNMVLNKETGELLDISYRIRTFPNMVIAHVGLEKTGKSSFKLHLLNGKDSTLSPILDTVNATIQGFNLSQID